MKKIATHSESVFQGMSIKNLVNHYNALANELKLFKPVKHFRDKKTAVARTMEAQGRYKKVLSEQKPTPKKSKPKKTTKPKKTESDGKLGKGHYDLNSNFAVNYDNPPSEKQAHNIFIRAIESGTTRAMDLIALFQEEFTRRSEGKATTYGFARGYLTGAIRKGFITLVEEK